MPTFRWKGRSLDGRGIEGKLTARSKEDVIARLREQRIVVSEITEPGSDGARDFRPPEPAAGFEPAAHLTGSRAPERPKRLRALVFIAACAAAAYGVLTDPARTFISTWAGSRAPMAGAGALLLLALLMLLLTVLSLFSRPTEWLHEQAARARARRQR